MNERSIEIVREYNFDPKEVVAGLNGYYESDKRNSYITVRRNDVEGPAYLTTALYRSALIEWLREDHDIFYRPGMTLDQIEAERNAAKMCCLRAHIKDEISKRGLWCGADADIPELVDTLFKAYNECRECLDRNRKDAVKLSEVNQELRKELNTLKDTVSKVRSRLNKKFCNDEYEDDLEKLAIIAVNAVEIRDATINNINVIRPYVLAHLKKTLQSRSISFDKKDEKDILKLIDLLALDRDNAWEENQKHKKSVFDLEKTCYRESYISDRIHEICTAKGVELDDTFLYNDDYTWEDLVGFLCEEIRKLKKEIKEVNDKRWKDLYDIHKALGSVVDLKQKDRAAVILQDLYRDIFKKQPDGLSAEDIANKILDRVLKTEDLLYKSVDSVNKECKATGRLMVEDYEKDLLQFIYKEYEDRIGLSDNTITYNPPSVRNTVLKIISDYARSRTRVDILETQIKSIFDKYKSKFTVDDYLINADPSSGLMLDCFSAWFRDISSAAESRGKIRAEIENYKLKLKDYILKDIKEHGYRYDGLETKSIEDIVDWIVTMATCARNEWAKDEIENLRGQISRLKDLINAMNEEVGDM